MCELVDSELAFCSMAESVLLVILNRLCLLSGSAMLFISYIAGNATKVREISLAACIAVQMVHYI